jgi:hypothetical protein
MRHPDGLADHSAVYVGIIHVDPSLHPSASGERHMSYVITSVDGALAVKVVLAKLGLCVQRSKCLRPSFSFETN